MSRYRPRQKPSSPYITQEGALKLRKELQYLWMEKRPEVTQAVSEAAAQGDRSENAEYIYGKKQLRQIDGRVRFLRKRLDVLQIINELPKQQDKIFFGAWVSIEDEQGEEKTFRIVGPDEFDAEENYISMDSPMAKSLLGKYVDDEIQIVTPIGKKTWYVTQIEYKTI